MSQVVSPRFHVLQLGQSVYPAIPAENLPVSDELKSLSISSTRRSTSSPWSHILRLLGSLVIPTATVGCIDYMGVAPRVTHFVFVYELAAGGGGATRNGADENGIRVWQ
jgi:hypothetical protein